MKRYIYILICSVSLMALQSCIEDDFNLEALPSGGDYISLDVSSMRLQTRASIASTAAEEAVSHLDVVIFNSAGNEKVYNGRILVDASYGTVNLDVKRSELFDVNAKYFVYVIANSSLPEKSFSELSSVDELHALTQTDERIHVSGTSVKDAPTHFLMDGVAFLNASGSATEPLKPAAVVLYDGNDKESTKLKVNLRRAAAKLVVRLYKGDNVEFVNKSNAGYYLRNMPYSTTLIPLANAEEKPHPALRTPDKTFFTKFDANCIEVVTYVYSHTWEVNRFFEDGTSLIVNIPLIYEGISYENSYYQIALRPSDLLNFDRNHQYTVTGTINAPGAEEVFEPIIIEELKYTVREWDEVYVDVNGENTPQYLALNHNILRMHNESKDSLTLQFSSSSKISISVFDVYYINKFGVKTRASANGISGRTSGGVSGNITVTSPLPTNNTIRYFGLAVMNEDGLKDTVYVEQYPLIYITNQQGWYSYRDDFKDKNSKPTTYKYKGDGVVNVSYVRTNVGTIRNPIYEYSYQYGTSSREGFWRSKVATPLGTGMSTINYYSWSGVTGDTPSTSIAENNSNARMYHVRVTSTSADYKVGRPRMTSDGYTDPGDDNAELVSPSFMIASRLGFVDISSGGITNANTDSLKVELYRNHCANYVEVYKDENENVVELRDWRLPTEAELKIIMELQGTDNNAEAIDFLLNAGYYVAANGSIKNTKVASTSTTAGRCVRDAYEK